MTEPIPQIPGAPVELSLPEFARKFDIRAPRIGLLIGAGASVTSGVPSAWDLIWDFKRRIYVHELGIHPSAFGSTSDPSVRLAIQTYFDAQSGAPPQGSEAEYSYYFERAYRDGEDRRLFIDRVVEGKRPHYGYLCLGALLTEKKVRWIWTPNFDTMVEQAYAQVSEGQSLSVVGRDTTARLGSYIADERFPILAKLHGDFRTDSLQNTSAELSALDDELRGGLVGFAQNNGLVVIGYSGRDQSIMDALSAAIEEHGATAFPGGLYWCLREAESPLPRVDALMDRAQRCGLGASYVRITDWDDFASALYRACETNSSLVDSKLSERKRPRQGYVLSRTSAREPLLKLNAIPITEYPESCFRFAAAVPGWAALRELTDGSAVVAALWKNRVYALGSRAEVQQVFAGCGLSDLQPSPITADHLRTSESWVLGMFYEAIARGLSTHPALSLAGGRRHRILYVARDHSFPPLLLDEFAKAGLRAGKSLVRHISQGGYWAHEAVEFGLDFREDQLWMLIKPTVYLTADGGALPWEDQSRMDVVRELLVERYNRQSSALFNFWFRTIRHCAEAGAIYFPPHTQVSRFVLAGTLGISYHRS